jgi:hypothetical protein
MSEKGIWKKIENAKTYEEYTQLTSDLRKYGIIARPLDEKAWLERQGKINEAKK